MDGFEKECGRCGVEFVVCRPCDGGRRYCPPCSISERAERVRGYRAAQRVTFRGRRARAARSARWRRKKAAQKETDRRLPLEAGAIHGESAELLKGAGEERADGVDLAGAMAERAADPWSATKSVLFTTAARMLNDLGGADVHGQITRALRKYTNPALLVTDDFAVLEMDTAQAKLAIQVISERYEHRHSTYITTNRPFKSGRRSSRTR